MDRILVIRGGAIGDFMVTLPALKALRDACPHAHIEILGYKHIAVLAENRFFAQAVRSIEYGPLSRFFARNSELPAELANYFGSFDLIISYLYDPDRIFENNVRRCGIENLLCGPPKIVENGGHAARQLARPIEDLGIRVVDLTERVFPSIEDRQFASDFLRSLQQPIIAIHPGSGSKEKNCPLENWIALFSRTGGFPDAEGKQGGHGKFPSLVVISGKRTNHRPSNWKASGKIEMFVSQKIYRCLSWQRCSSARSSLDTTAESRISLRPRGRTASCSSVQQIPTCGRPGTKTYEFSWRQVEG